MRRPRKSSFVVLALAVAGVTLVTSPPAAAVLSSELVEDINTTAFQSSNPRWTAAMGDYVYFQADDGANGLELWRSNGTDTEMVKDINLTPNPGAPDTFGSAPAQFTVVGSTMYFVASNGTDGFEVWKTDGTESGTQMIENINTGGDSVPSGDPINNGIAHLTNANGVLFFVAFNGSDREIWRSTDGTAVGTSEFDDLTGDGTSSHVIGMEHDGSGGVYACADNGSDVEDEGSEMWHSNGSLPFTTHEIRTGPDDSCGATERDMAVHNGVVYFRGLDAPGQLDLWRYDGTATPTRAADLLVGGDDDADTVTVANGKVLYNARASGQNYQVFSHTPGSPGAIALTPTSPAQSGPIVSTGLFALFPYNGFTWRTDGTTPGTTQVEQVEMSGGDFTEPAVSGSQVVFKANTDQVWTSDGTAAGTFEVVQDASPAVDTPASNFAAANTGFYYTGTVGATGNELYRIRDVIPDSTVTVVSNGNGRVESNPWGIRCGSDCSRKFVEGTQISLFAIANSGETFQDWGGDCDGQMTTTCTLNVGNDDMLAVATFSGAPPQHALTVDVTGDGSVSSSPSGINCGTDCTESYNENTPVTLTASPVTGGAFQGWTGDCTGTTNPCQVTMSAAKSVTATFATLPTISINDVALREGRRGRTKEFIFTVTLSALAPSGATAHYEVEDGTAKTPSDYIDESGTVTFSPADLTQTISVTVKGDRRREKSEKFTVFLSAPSGATILDGTGTGTIKNDDR